MQTNVNSLPDDPALLKQMLADLQQQLASEKGKNEQLALRLNSLLRQRFGRSSEKTANPEQLDLLIEDTETEIAQNDQDHDRTPQNASSLASRSRKPFNPSLPRDQRRYEPASCQCPSCGNSMKHIGDDVSEMLHVIPEQYVVIQNIRPKYGCSDCDQIAQAPARERVIDKGMASAALIA